MHERGISFQTGKSRMGVARVSFTANLLLFIPSTTAHLGIW